MFEQSNSFTTSFASNPTPTSPELLTGKALEVLYYIDQPRTVAEITD
jgi:hypothetical protein